MFSEGILEHLQETKVVDFLDELEIPAYVVDKTDVSFLEQAGYKVNRLRSK